MRVLLGIVGKVWCRVRRRAVMTAREER